MEHHKNRQQRNSTVWGRNTSLLRHLLRVLVLCALLSEVLSLWACAEDPDRVYAILYTDGTLVFQHENAPDYSRTVKETYSVNLTTAYTFDSSANTSTVPWFSERKSIRYVEFLDAVSPVSTAYWFNNCGRLERIDGIGNVNTSRTTDMKYMFHGCSSLKKLDLSGFDTANVASFWNMFNGCENLQTLDLSGWDTSRAKDMSFLFTDCKSLVELDLADFDTTSVTRMSSMFRNCVKLEKIYTSKDFSTQAVASGASDDMFTDCITLTGGKGTAYDSRYTNQSYARIDGVNGLNGYLTDANVYALLYTDGRMVIQNGDTADTSRTLKNTYLLDMKGALVWNNNDTALTVEKYTDEKSTTHTANTVRLEGTDNTGSHWYSERDDIQVVVISGRVRPVSTAYWFYGCGNLLRIENLEKLDTSQTRDMGWMFADCASLQSLDLSGFNTARATSMAGMFSGCTSLKTLDLSGFNTARVSAMYEMFRNCASLSTLNLSRFNTALVMDMHGMFDGCASLASLDLSGFNTTQVATMRNMFHNCGLRRLDLSGFATSQVTDMGGMFDGCASLASLDLSGWETSRVTDMGGMFNGCSQLSSLDLSSFSTGNVAHTENMFANCTRLSVIRASDAFTTKSVQTDENMFASCTSLSGSRGTIYESRHTDKLYARVDGGAALPGYFTNNNIYAVLYRDGTLAFQQGNPPQSRQSVQETYQVPSTAHYTWDSATASPTVPWYSLRESIRVVKFEEPVSPLYMAYWFYDCKNLQKFVQIENLNTAYVRDMGWLFAGCSGLKELDLSHFQTSSATSLSNMFSGCTGLAKLDLSHFDTSHVTTLLEMFSGCTCLAELNLSHWDTSQAVEMGSIFSGCSALRVLDLSGFSTYQAVNTSGMFRNCSQLTTIYALSGFPVRSVESGKDMFLGCTALVGGRGTKYDGVSTNAAFAQIDGGSAKPGYFTDGNLYAILCTDGTLVFQRGEQIDSHGSIKKSYLLDIDAVYQEAAVVPWYAERESLLSVEFADSITPPSLAYWFNGCANLTSLTNLEHLDTSKVADMTRMFRDCKKLETLDLSSFDTAQTVTLSEMFRGCVELAKVTLSGWDTASVADMSGMFSGCTDLVALDLSGFDTRSVENMNEMFFGCTGMTSLDLSGFQTGNVGTMTEMFRGCTGLRTVNLSGWNTEQTTNMGGMFYGSENLKTIYVSDTFTTRSVTESASMFYNCLALVGGQKTTYASNHTDAAYARIDGGKDNPGYFTDYNLYAILYENGMLSFQRNNTPESGQKVKATYTMNTAAEYTSEKDVPWYDVRETILSADFVEPVSLMSTENLFSGCSSLGSVIGIDKLDVSHVTTMDAMFSGCASLRELDLTGWNTAHVESAVQMFSGCEALTDLKLTGWDTAQFTTVQKMFANCKTLASLDLSGWDTASATNFSGAFTNCAALTSLDLSGWNTAQATDLSALFSGCEALAELKLDGWDTARVKNLSAVFAGCKALARLDLSGWDTAQATDFSDLFSGCEALENLNLTGWDTYNVLSMSGMFSGCKKLKALDVTKFDVYHTENMSGMFSGCAALETLDLSNFSTSRLTNASGMFQDCAALQTILVSDKFTTRVMASSQDMFAACTALKGGRGTVFDPAHTDAAYARLDGGSEEPGYFSEPGSQITILSAAVTGDTLSVSLSAAADASMLAAATWYSAAGDCLTVQVSTASGISTTFPLPAGLPAAYTVQVVLLRADTLQPLCPAFETRKA